MILLSRLISSTTRISSKISTSFDVNLILNWTFMSSILLSNSSIPFSMSTCSTLEVYYLKVTRKYLPYSDGSFASSVFESFISFFKALYFLNSWPSCKFFKNVWPHSSLLSVFGLSATSTYDSYLPLIFGIFGLIWGHFWNVRKGRFRGHGGRRGQTTSKSKTTKILNQNLLKLDEIQNLTSATSKMASWPQRPRKWLSGFFQKIHF